MKKVVIIILVVSLDYLRNHISRIRCNNIHQEYEGSPLLNRKLSENNCYNAL